MGIACICHYFVICSKILLNGVLTRHLDVRANRRSTHLAPVIQITKHEDNSATGCQYLDDGVIIEAIPIVLKTSVVGGRQPAAIGVRADVDNVVTAL